MPSLPFSRIGRPRHPDVLTPTEWEILAGVREGLSNRAIAERRGCDLETVRFHLKNVRRKLSVQGREQLRAFPGRPAESIAHARAGGEARVREQIPLVHVRDMERSLAFYCGALGFDVVSRWPDDDRPPGWAALAAGGARLMLRVGHPRRRIDPSRRAGSVCMNFYVEGLDAVRRELLRAGIRCDEPQALFYGAREFYLLDPDGNEIAIVEFAASDPAYLREPSEKRERSGMNGDPDE
jgi:DNA-binding CsgD family transcriptional regulator/catechol 2,3-dioxygenase-like lactoylglutathione lyase family enzyme